MSTVELVVDEPGPELFMLPYEVASELEVSRRDLRRLRDAGSGPAYFKIGSAIRYLPSDVQAWIDEHPEGTKIPRRRNL